LARLAFEEKEKKMDDDVKDLIENMKKDKDKPKKFWTPASDKEGSYPLRILPRIKDKGEKLFYFHHRVHWINNVAYECLKQDIPYGKDGTLHESEKCPVCDFVQKLYSTSERDTEEWSLAGQLKAQDRFIYRVIVRGSEDETKPVFYEAGKTVQEILFHIIAESDFGNITDLKNGRDFLLDKKGTKRMSNYKTSSPSAKETPVFTDVNKIRALIENMKQMDYSPLIEFSTFDQLKTVLLAFINDDSLEVKGPSENDEKLLEKLDQTPSAKVSAPASKTEDIDDMLKDLGFDA
jgi:hypothetical protein